MEPDPASNSVETAILLTRDERIGDKRIVISWSPGTSAMLVVVRALDIDALQKTIEKFILKGLVGDDLIAGLATAAESNIIEIRRYCDSKMTDSANGEPAWRWFENGELVQAQHFDNGVLQKTITREDMEKAKADDSDRRAREIFEKRYKILSDKKRKRGGVRFFPRK